MTDLIDQLKGAPPMTSGEPDVEMPRQRFGPGRKPGAAAKPAKRTAREPFAQATDPLAPGDVNEVSFTQEQAAQLKVLWDDYVERQRVIDAPRTTQYRCLGYRPDGTLCGEIVEAGTREHRLETGLAVRCPHGPDVPHEGIRFDRERWPQWHNELTPMDEV